MSSARTALILGGSGMAGRGIAAELVAAGWTVTNLARGTTAQEVQVFAETLVADRRSAEAMRLVLAGRSFDLVVDCSAFHAAEVATAADLLQGRCGHYVFISTDFVYAPDPAARFPLTEDAPKIRGYGYADGKLAAESVLLERWNHRGFGTTSLRPQHIVGAGKPVGCVPGALRDRGLPERLRRGMAVPLLAEGQFLIQPVWSREIGRCIATLAHLPAAFGQIFNIAGADLVTTRRYYEIVSELCGAPPLSVSDVDVTGFCRDKPDEAHFARHRLYSLEHLRRLTGFQPTLGLREALRETLGTEART